MGAQPDTSTSAPEVWHGVQQILAPIFVAKLLATYLALPWQFKGTFQGISVGYEFRIGKAKRRRYLWKRKNCQSSVRSPAHPADRPAAVLTASDRVAYSTQAMAVSSRNGKN